MSSSRTNQIAFAPGCGHLLPACGGTKAQYGAALAPGARITICHSCEQLMPFPTGTSDPSPTFSAAPVPTAMPAQHLRQPAVQAVGPGVVTSISGPSNIAPPPGLGSHHWQAESAMPVATATAASLSGGPVSFIMLIKHSP
jgi:hypothetical protein